MCKLTPTTEIIITNRGFLVDGVLMPSLKNCQVIGDVRLVVGAKDIEPRAVVSPGIAPTVQETPQPIGEPLVLPPTQTPAPAQQTTPTIQTDILPDEIRELAQVYQAFSSFGPVVALSVLAAFALYKFKLKKKKPKRDDEEHDCPHAAQVVELTKRIEALERKASACPAAELLANLKSL